MILRAPLLSLLSGQRLRPVMSKETHEDLEALARLIEGGEVTPVVDGTFALVEAAEAVPMPGAGARSREGRRAGLAADRGPTDRDSVSAGFSFAVAGNGTRTADEIPRRDCRIKARGVRQQGSAAPTKGATHAPEVIGMQLPVSP